MTRHLSPLWLSLLLPAAGCFADGPNKLVSANPFGSSAPVKQASFQASVTPATEGTAKRVGLIGQKLLAANRQAAVQPLFQTIGAPQPEIFHRDAHAIFITEGLVRQCQSDGQLAAVLALELGKIVSEREALAPPVTRVPDRWLPQEVRVGNDSGGPFGSADGTRLAELAKLEKQRGPAANLPPLPPPSPEALARSYLKKAGYSSDDLSDVTPLLRKAEGNAAFEKQFKDAANAASK
jgi:hypothetical protein